MKAHSERVKNKNIRLIDGQPLFYFILKTLERCRTVSTIYVDTDSDFIKKKIGRDFINIHIIDRPSELAKPDVPMNDVIAYDLSMIEGKYFLQAHATNPLLRRTTIDKAVEVFYSTKEYDSLFTVTRVLKRFYNLSGKPINHDPNILLNTQDLTPLFEENSCIYLFTRESFNLKKNRIGNRPFMYEIDKSEALDIDDELDFSITECMLNALNTQMQH